MYPTEAITVCSTGAAGAAEGEENHKYSNTDGGDEEHCSHVQTIH